MTGGGGGGGSHNGDDAQGGGGAGGTCIKTIDVTNIGSVVLTVGGGGDGSVGNTNRGGGKGDPSNFMDCVGVGGVHPVAWGIGGQGGEASGGDVNIVGGFGHTGNIDGSGNSEAGGNGGDSVRKMLYQTSPMFCFCPPRNVSSRPPAAAASISGSSLALSFLIISSPSFTRFIYQICTDLGWWWWWCISLGKQ